MPAIMPFRTRLLLPVVTLLLVGASAFSSPAAHRRGYPPKAADRRLRPLYVRCTADGGAGADGSTTAASEPSVPDAPERTEVGSAEYYKGFVSTPIAESRGDGTEQAIKLGGGAVAIVGALLVGFMASNGLL